MKHLSWPRSLVAILTLIALFTMGCQANIGEPDGWTAPVQVGELTIVQQKRGELAAIRLSAIDDPLTQKIDERILWLFPGDDDDLELDAIYANLIVDDDTLYVAGYSGDVLALDLSANPPRALWLLNLDSHIVSTPAFDGDTLFVVTESGELIPIDVKNGAAGSSLASTGGRTWSQPMLASGIVYIAGLDKRIRAIETTGGKEKWSEALSGAVPGNPALGNSMLVVGSFDRVLHAFDTATGSADWSFSGDGWFWAQPLIAGNVVYAATTSGSVYALNLEGPAANRERWKVNTIDSEIRAAPLLISGVLVIATEEGTILGLSPTDGTTLWAKQLVGHRFLADPLQFGASLIYATARGDLIELDPLSGQAAVVYERQ